MTLAVFDLGITNLFFCFPSNERCSRTQSLLPRKVGEYVVLRGSYPLACVPRRTAGKSNSLVA